MSKFQFLLSEETKEKLLAYKEALAGGKSHPGKYFKAKLEQVCGGQKLEDFIASLSEEAFLRILISSKKHRLFAESEVRHDGSDWNETEASILGDITVMMDVDFFNDGAHFDQKDHGSAINGTLCYVPGALLTEPYVTYLERF